MAKCLDIQFYDIFLVGNARFQIDAVKVSTAAESCRLTGQTVVGDSWRRQRRGRRQLISLLAKANTRMGEFGIGNCCQPLCSRVALVLDLTLTYYVQFELMGADQPQNTI